MKGILRSCILATALVVGTTAGVQADTMINGSAMPLLSYSSAASQGTTTFGSTSGTTAQFKTDGYAGMYIQVTNPAGAAVTFTASAGGTASSGVNPDMTISIADYSQSFNVTPGSTNAYQFTTPVLPKGTYFVRTQMDNQAGSVTPQLNLASMSVSSNATVLVGASGNTDANALNAANTYIQYFRQGAGTVSTGFASGTQLNMKLVHNAFNFGGAVSGFNQSDINSYLSTNGSFMASNFNMLVPDNAGKWAYNESKTGSSSTVASGNQFTVGMSAPDTVMAFAKSHHMAGRMHNLIWSNSSETPAYVNTEINASGTSSPTTNLQNLISDRIGYYLGGGLNPPASTGWTVSASTPYPGNQLNTKTNDIRAADFSQVDILNEPFHQSPR